VKKSISIPLKSIPKAEYGRLLEGLTQLLHEAHRASARSVNAVMTATYWEIGRRIVEFEQRGKVRAEYGEELIDRLSSDLSKRFGRGFGRRNVFQIRAFFLAYRRIVQTPSAQLADKLREGKMQTASAKSQTLSGQFQELTLKNRFPLSWSHYVRLLSVDNPDARAFYEAEALRGGWSVRQLDRQISTLFYERTALSRDKAKMLSKGAHAEPGEKPTPEEEIKDPLVLEFLGLKDEYSESALEEALIRHL
jgi:hypothetical protein